MLKPGGWLLVSFHIGDGTTHLDEFLGVEVSLDFYFFDPALVRLELINAGLDVTEVIERAPYDETIEAQTKRAYLFARKV